MSSSVEIPFTFNPINTGITSSSYTVPNGKYALIYSQNCSLLKLNGQNLYYTYTYNDPNPPYLPITTTVEYNKVFWVKSGDILEFSSGVLVYSEFKNNK